MAVRSSSRPVRYTRPQPARFAPKKKRFRKLKRLFFFLTFLLILFFAVRAYLLVVYAPGLRQEARSIPTRVQGQLAQHDTAYTPLRNVSPNLRHAIVAIEDRRFYTHQGIDPIGIVRAMWINITAQQIDQGGSTLEEQLAKRVIIFDDHTARAKLRELALAWAIDQDFPKWKILELYLNDAYYGQGAYGPEGAARIYFGTDAAHLTIAQAAFLAAMPQAPSVYGAHPRSPAVIFRWKSVLQSMEDQGYITPQERQQAEATTLTFALPNP
jgi:membrane peptidoglycan carboxypeptidase